MPATATPVSKEERQRERNRLKQRRHNKREKARREGKPDDFYLTADDYIEKAEVPALPQKKKKAPARPRAKAPAQVRIEQPIPQDDDEEDEEDEEIDETSLVYPPWVKWMKWGGLLILAVFLYLLIFSQGDAIAEPQRDAVAHE